MLTWHQLLLIEKENFDKSELDKATTLKQKIDNSNIKKLKKHRKKQFPVVINKKEQPKATGTTF